MVQHNRDFYRLLRGGVPVEYRDATGQRKSARARAIDFDNAAGANRFLAVRELKLTGRRTPGYNRRADIVCFVNGLPLVLIELKAVCECGRKATMNLRVDAEGHAVAAGAQTEIGGNDRYIALCRKHFLERLRESEARQLSLKLPRF